VIVIVTVGGDDARVAWRLGDSVDRVAGDVPLPHPAADITVQTPLQRRRCPHDGPLYRRSLLIMLAPALQESRPREIR
jgi:hypothetical protein